MDEKKVRETIAWMETKRKLHKYGAYKGPTIPKEQIDMIEEYYNLAIEALEKQLPEKPRENGMQDGLIRKIKYYTCPTCGNCLLTEMMNERQNTSYCWDCGQKLDWSEEDE